MVFHRARIKSDEQAVITIDNVILQTTNSLKYLGVVIDHKLNWTQHIAHVRNKNLCSILTKGSTCRKNKNFVDLSRAGHDKSVEEKISVLAQINNVREINALK